MHRHGLVHGDLKPENVLLSDETASSARFGRTVQKSHVDRMQRHVCCLWACGNSPRFQVCSASSLFHAQHSSMCHIEPCPCLGAAASWVSCHVCCWNQHVATAKCVLSPSEHIPRLPRRRQRPSRQAGGPGQLLQRRQRRHGLPGPGDAEPPVPLAGGAALDPAHVGIRPAATHMLLLPSHPRRAHRFQERCVCLAQNMRGGSGICARASALLVTESSSSGGLQYNPGCSILCFTYLSKVY